MLANSKNQNLVLHSIAVAITALKLFEVLDIKENNLLKKTIDNIENYKKNIFLAGLLHDIGKVDNVFQEYLNKNQVSDSENKTHEDGVHIIANSKTFSFIDYPRHNEISWAISEKLGLSIETKYAIYYHHATLIRNNDKGLNIEFDSKKILNRVIQENEDFEENINSFFKECMQYKVFFEKYSNEIIDLNEKINFDEEISEIKPPNFLYQNKEMRDYSENKREKIDLEESKKLLIRTLIVSADRIVSALEADSLKEYIEDINFHSFNELIEKNSDGLKHAILNMIERFNIKNEKNPINRERDRQQSECAKKLAEKESVATLFGPAGCGKTKIFLQWYSEKLNINNEKSKKLFIIAPRKMICSSLFDELRNEYIPEAKIELITGEVKKFWNGQTVEYFENDNQFVSDVTITTIDQLISIMLSHKKIDMLLEFLNSYVVFDEFHELFNINGIVLIFKLFMKLKMMLDKPNVLLVSATPNYFFLEQFLGIKNSVEEIKTFNDKDYKIIYEIYSNSTQNNAKQLENSILYQPQKEGSILIFNTAKESQLTTLYVNEDKVINFHSKFTPNDREEIYNNILKNWKHKIPSSEYVLRAGPIVQASLNISTMNLVTQLCSAENWLQRVGRANRFAANGVANVITVISEMSINKITANNAEAKFLDKIAAKEQTFEWIDFLGRNMNGNSCVLKLPRLYELYKDFHQLPSTQIAYKNDFEKIIEKSLINFIKNDFTPKEFFKPKKKSKAKKLSAKSIRGSSVYVLPVKYDYVNKKINNWLYIPSDKTNPKDLLSIGEEELQGNGQIFTAQKHVLGNISINGFQDATYSSMKAYSKKSDNAIKIEAKNPTSPILLSYVGTIPNSSIYNKESFVYANKGLVKIGLIKLTI